MRKAANSFFKRRFWKERRRWEVVDGIVIRHHDLDISGEKERRIFEYFESIRGDVSFNVPRLYESDLKTAKIEFVRGVRGDTFLHALYTLKGTNHFELAHASGNSFIKRLASDLDEMQNLPFDVSLTDQAYDVHSKVVSDSLEFCECFGLGLRYQGAEKLPFDYK